MKSILVVDDEAGVRYSFQKMLANEGYNVILASSGEEAVESVKSHPADLIIMDIKMKGMSGLDALQKIKEISPKQIIILMTAYGTTEITIEAMSLGAYDYIIKPFNNRELKELISKGLQASELMKENIYIQKCCENDLNGNTIIGNSKKMQDIYKLVGQVASSDVPVLITGESGTGKELVAKAVYSFSLRKDKPFMAVNCAAIPDTLLENELFGHEKGAYTGADKRYIGKFEQCDNGTIFLDEIGDMPLATQGKILRILQDGIFERLGGTGVIKVNVRIIAATNKDLEKLISAGVFREDLYFRLNVLQIKVPPLNERREDILLLVEYFLQKFSKELGKEITGMDKDVEKYLMNKNWMGNVRELCNLVKRAVLLCKTPVIGMDCLGVEDKNSNGLTFNEQINKLGNSIKNQCDMIFSYPEASHGNGLFDTVMGTVERMIIEKMLEKTGGNQVQAANLLGISRNTLRKKIGLDLND